MPSTDRNNADNTKISRAEIEALCLLDAVGDRGCSISDLPARLGFSSLLSQPVNEAIEPLVASGWIERRRDTVALTDAGHRHLHERLAKFR